MTTTASTSRRGVLATVAAGFGGLAGCLGPSNTPSGDVTPVESLPAPVQGDPDADVTVMVFEDFSCPHCATYSLEILPDVEAEYVEPGTVRYEHHDYPIPVDGRWSWAVAGAARAVQDSVGDAAFFEYAHLLFQNQDQYSMDLLAQLAEEVDAEPATVRSAAENGTYRPALEADRQRGADLGLDGTPEIFVNGEKTPDPTFETIAAAIEGARS